MARTGPQQFGKYLLVRRLAVGGMAEIFKAKVAGAEGFEKDLVIKRILPHFSEDPTFVRMFVDEARLTAKLQHTNIVQVFDFDAIDGSYYIAMEYVEGKDLKDVLSEAQRQGDGLTVPQCVWIAAEVAKGLHYAHTKEDKGEALHIVHRDVTPSNVMISYRGDVKLTDFGVAKAALRSTKTQAGAVKGKVAYMSPEQARGKPLDRRSDLFALGVLLWELLTRRRLFMAESDFETLNNVLRMEAPPPSSLNPECSPELDPIVAKCIAKEPGDRYPSCEALARELTRWFYAQVTDFEKEKLKPLMYRVFKRDIDQLDRQTEEDDALADGEAPTNAAVSAATPEAERRPVRNPLADTAIRPEFAQTANTTTRAAVTTMNAPAYAPAPLAKPRRGSPLPWILLLVLLLVGATALVLLLTKGDDTDRDPDAMSATGDTGTGAASPTVDAAAEATVEHATLYLKVDPHTAKVRVDGRVVDGEVAGLSVGQAVKIVAEAPGYKRYEAVVTLAESAPMHGIVLEKEGVPHRLLIRPSAANDEVFVDDARLGLGAQPFDGVLGQELTIKVVPASGAAPVTRVLLLEATMAEVAIVTPGVLLVSLEPAGARLSASAGTLEVRSPGLVAVNGVGIGSQVTLEVTAEGHKPLKREVTLSEAMQPLAFKLEKAAAPPPEWVPSGVTGPGEPAGPGEPGVPVRPAVPWGKGSIKVSARPWAQVTVNGKPYGTTPVEVKDLTAGRYTVVLTKGPQQTTRSVTVGAGKQAQVYVDFTTL